MKTNQTPPTSEAKHTRKSNSQLWIGKFFAVGPTQANAEFMVQAVNAHADLLKQRDELLEALKECITDKNAHCLTTEDRERAMFKRLEAINQQARAALARVESGVEK